MAADAKTLSPALPDALIEQAIDILRQAHDADMRIATAESCTGGLLASLLTDIEGMSNVFDCGFVVYSEDAKCNLLGLEHHLIDTCGAVSEPVARAMAQGAITNSSADIAVAITGFAGHAGPKDEPGLVHFACAAKTKESIHRVQHFGDIGRGATRIKCLEVALAMLQDFLSTYSPSRK